MISPHKTLELRCRANIAALFDTYCAHTGLSQAATSEIMHGERSIYHRVKNGTTSFRVSTYDAIVARFATCWPPALAWPKGIEKVAEEDVLGGVSTMRVDPPDATLPQSPAGRERGRLREIANRLGIARGPKT